MTLGSKTPIGKGLYLQVQGTRHVYVVPETLERLFAKSPEDFKNRPTPAPSIK